MASADQIKSLIRSHFSGESEKFYAVVLQVAATEAAQGHGALAHEIRAIVDRSRRQERGVIVEFPPEVQGLVSRDEHVVPKAALVTSKILVGRIDRVIHEYRKKSKLKTHGLENRRRLMFVGPPGTGKTMTARVLSHELQLPLFVIQLDRVVTKFMGETSSKLRQVFDLIQREHGIYLFDEFDAIGGERSRDNDVAEMRRVLNSFLQFIERDRSESLIIAISNSPRILDKALFRRFDDVMHYTNPAPEQRRRLMENIVGTYLGPKFRWQTVLTESSGLSHAEIDHACRDAIKEIVLTDRKRIDTILLRRLLGERASTHR